MKKNYRLTNNVKCNSKKSDYPYFEYKVRILKIKNTSDYLITVFYTVWDKDNQSYVKKLSWKDINGITGKELKKELTPTKANSDIISLYGCDWRWDFPYHPVYKDVWIKALNNVVEISFKQYAFIINDLHNDYKRDMCDIIYKQDSLVHKIQEKVEIFVEDKK